MPDTINTIKQDTLTWHNIVKPTKKTTEFLSKKYKFHHLDLEDCLSKIQRPKIDEYDRYIFIVLHFPYYDKVTDSIQTDELDIFVGGSYVISLSPGNKVLSNLFNKVKRSKKLREKYMGAGSGYLLYYIINDMFGACFPLLDSISEEINDIESIVFEMENPKDMLKDILYLKKDIISFRRIIIPQRIIVPQLEHKNKKFLSGELDIYFDDVVDKVEKIYNNLETLSEIINTLNDTNESILSHNTNNVIKILTIFSVIMLPLTFITGFYGMNVQGLPVANHPLATVIISAGLVGVVVLMLIFFRSKRWM
ncbi:magnesium transporter CorA family protein [bacterium]|nr:magnesium transporter CorA family protein [bacterium]